MNKEWKEILNNNSFWAEIINCVIDNTTITPLPKKNGHNPEFVLSVKDLLKCKDELLNLIDKAK